jgi:hypothetical protein
MGCIVAGPQTSQTLHTICLEEKLQGRHAVQHPGFLGAKPLSEPIPTTCLYNHTLLHPSRPCCFSGRQIETMEHGHLCDISKQSLLTSDRKMIHVVISLRPTPRFDPACQQILTSSRHAHDIHKEWAYIHTTRGEMSQARVSMTHRMKSDTIQSWRQMATAEAPRPQDTERVTLLDRPRRLRKHNSIATVGVHDTVESNPVSPTPS